MFQFNLARWSQVFVKFLICRIISQNRVLTSAEQLGVLSNRSNLSHFNFTQNFPGRAESNVKMRNVPSSDFSIEPLNEDEYFPSDSEIVSFDEERLYNIFSNHNKHQTNETAMHQRYHSSAINYNHRSVTVEQGIGRSQFDGRGKDMKSTSLKKRRKKKIISIERKKSFSEISSVCNQCSSGNLSVVPICSKKLNKKQDSSSPEKIVKKAHIHLGDGSTCLLNANSPSRNNSCKECKSEKECIEKADCASKSEKSETARKTFKLFKDSTTSESKIMKTKLPSSKVTHTTVSVSPCFSSTSICTISHGVTTSDSVFQSIPSSLSKISEVSKKPEEHPKKFFLPISFGSQSKCESTSETLEQSVATSDSVFESIPTSLSKISEVSKKPKEHPKKFPLPISFGFQSKCESTSETLEQSVATSDSVFESIPSSLSKISEVSKKPKEHPKKFPLPISFGSQSKCESTSETLEQSVATSDSVFESLPSTFSKISEISKKPEEYPKKFFLPISCGSQSKCESTSEMLEQSKTTISIKIQSISNEDPNSSILNKLNFMSTTSIFPNFSKKLEKTVNHPADSNSEEIEPSREENNVTPMASDPCSTSDSSNKFFGDNYEVQVLSTNPTVLIKEEVISPVVGYKTLNNESAFGIDINLSNSPVTVATEENNVKDSDTSVVNLISKNNESSTSLSLIELLDSVQKRGQLLIDLRNTSLKIPGFDILPSNKTLRVDHSSLANISFSLLDESGNQVTPCNYTIPFVVTVRTMQDFNKTSNNHSEISNNYSKTSNNDSETSDNQSETSNHSSVFHHHGLLNKFNNTSLSSLLDLNLNPHENCKFWKFGSHCRCMQDILEKKGGLYPDYNSDKKDREFTVEINATSTDRVREIQTFNKEDKIDDGVNGNRSIVGADEINEQDVSSISTKIGRTEVVNATTKIYEIGKPAEFFKAPNANKAEQLKNKTFKTIEIKKPNGTFIPILSPDETTQGIKMLPTSDSVEMVNGAEKVCLEKLELLQAIKKLILNDTCTDDLPSNNGSMLIKSEHKSVGVPNFKTNISNRNVSDSENIINSTHELIDNTENVFTMVTKLPFLISNALSKNFETYSELSSYDQTSVVPSPNKLDKFALKIFMDGREIYNDLVSRDFFHSIKLNQLSGSLKGKHVVASHGLFNVPKEKSYERVKIQNGENLAPLNTLTTLNYEEIRGREQKGILQKVKSKVLTFSKTKMNSLKDYKMNEPLKLFLNHPDENESKLQENLSMNGDEQLSSFLRRNLKCDYDYDTQVSKDIKLKELIVPATGSARVKRTSSILSSQIETSEISDEGNTDVLLLKMKANDLLPPALKEFVYVSQDSKSNDHLSLSANSSSVTIPTGDQSPSLNCTLASAQVSSTNFSELQTAPCSNYTGFNREMNVRKNNKNATSSLFPVNNYSISSEVSSPLLTEPLNPVEARKSSKSQLEVNSSESPSFQNYTELEVKRSGSISSETLDNDSYSKNTSSNNFLDIFLNTFGNSSNHFTTNSIKNGFSVDSSHILKKLSPQKVGGDEYFSLFLSDVTNVSDSKNLNISSSNKSTEANSARKPLSFFLNSNMTLNSCQDNLKPTTATLRSSHSFLKIPDYNLPNLSATPNLPSNKSSEEIFCPKKNLARNNEIFLSLSSNTTNEPKVYTSPNATNLAFNLTYLLKHSSNPKWFSTHILSNSDKTDPTLATFVKKNHFESAPVSLVTTSSFSSFSCLGNNLLLKSGSLNSDYSNSNQAKEEFVTGSDVINFSVLSHKKNETVIPGEAQNNLSAIKISNFSSLDLHKLFFSRVNPSVNFDPKFLSTSKVETKSSFFMNSSSDLQWPNSIVLTENVTAPTNSRNDSVSTKTSSTALMNNASICVSNFVVNDTRNDISANKLTSSKQSNSVMPINVVTASQFVVPTKNNFANTQSVASDVLNAFSPSTQRSNEIRVSHFPSFNLQVDDLNTHGALNSSIVYIQNTTILKIPVFLAKMGNLSSPNSNFLNFSITSFAVSPKLSNETPSNKSVANSFNNFMNTENSAFQKLQNSSFFKIGNNEDTASSTPSSNVTSQSFSNFSEVPCIVSADHLPVRKTMAQILNKDSTNGTQKIPAPSFSGTGISNSLIKSFCNCNISSGNSFLCKVTPQFSVSTEVESIFKNSLKNDLCDPCCDKNESTSLQHLKSPSALNLPFNSSYHFKNNCTAGVKKSVVETFVSSSGSSLTHGFNQLMKFSNTSEDTRSLRTYQSPFQSPFFFNFTIKSLKSPSLETLIMPGIRLVTHSFPSNTYRIFPENISYPLKVRTDLSSFTDSKVTRRKKVYPNFNADVKNKFQFLTPMILLNRSVTLEPNSSGSVLKISVEEKFHEEQTLPSNLLTVSYSEHSFISSASTAMLPVTRITFENSTYSNPAFLFQSSIKPGLPENLGQGKNPQKPLIFERKSNEFRMKQKNLNDKKCFVKVLVFNDTEGNEYHIMKYNNKSNGLVFDNCLVLKQNNESSSESALSPLVNSTLLSLSSEQSNDSLKYLSNDINVGSSLSPLILSDKQGLSQFTDEFNKITANQEIQSNFIQNSGQPIVSLKQDNFNSTTLDDLKLSANASYDFSEKSPESVSSSSFSYASFWAFTPSATNTPLSINKSSYAELVDHSIPPPSTSAGNSRSPSLDFSTASLPFKRNEESNSELRNHLSISEIRRGDILKKGLDSKPQNETVSSTIAYQIPRPNFTSGNSKFLSVDFSTTSLPFVKNGKSNSESRSHVSISEIRKGDSLKKGLDSKPRNKTVSSTIAYRNAVEKSSMTLQPSLSLSTMSSALKNTSKSCVLMTHDKDTTSCQFDSLNLNATQKPFGQHQPLANLTKNTIPKQAMTVPKINNKSSQTTNSKILSNKQPENCALNSSCNHRFVEQNRNISHNNFCISANQSLPFTSGSLNTVKTELNPIERTQQSVVDSANYNESSSSSLKSEILLAKSPKSKFHNKMGGIGELFSSIPEYSGINPPTPSAYQVDKMNVNQPEEVAFEMIPNDQSQLDLVEAMFQSSTSSPEPPAAFNGGQSEFNSFTSGSSLIWNQPNADWFVLNDAFTKQAVEVASQIPITLKPYFPENFQVNGLLTSNSPPGPPSRQASISIYPAFNLFQKNDNFETTDQNFMPSSSLTQVPRVATADCKDMPANQNYILRNQPRLGYSAPPAANINQLNFLGAPNNNAFINQYRSPAQQKSSFEYVAENFSPKFTALKSFGTSDSKLDSLSKNRFLVGAPPEYLCNPKYQSEDQSRFFYSSTRAGYLNNKVNFSVSLVSHSPPKYFPVEPVAVRTSGTNTILSSVGKPPVNLGEKVVLAEGHPISPILVDKMSTDSSNPSIFNQPLKVPCSHGATPVFLVINNYNQPYTTSASDQKLLNCKKKFMALPSSGQIAKIRILTKPDIFASLLKRNRTSSCSSSEEKNPPTVTTCICNPSKSNFKNHEVCSERRIDGFNNINLTKDSGTLIAEPKASQVESLVNNSSGASMDAFIIADFPKRNSHRQVNPIVNDDSFCVNSTENGSTPAYYIGPINYSVISDRTDHVKDVSEVDDSIQSMSLISLNNIDFGSNISSNDVPFLNPSNSFAEIIIPANSSEIKSLDVLETVSSDSISFLHAKVSSPTFTSEYPGDTSRNGETQKINFSSISHASDSNVLLSGNVESDVGITHSVGQNVSRRKNDGIEVEYELMQPSVLILSPSSSVLHSNASTFLELPSKNVLKVYGDEKSSLPDSSKVATLSPPLQILNPIIVMADHNFSSQRKVVGSHFPVTPALHPKKTNKFLSLYSNLCTLKKCPSKPSKSEFVWNEGENSGTIDTSAHHIAQSSNMAQPFVTNESPSKINCPSCNIDQFHFTGKSGVINPCYHGKMQNVNDALLLNGIGNVENSSNTSKENFPLTISKQLKFEYPKNVPSLSTPSQLNRPVLLQNRTNFFEKVQLTDNHERKNLLTINESKNLHVEQAKTSQSPCRYNRPLLRGQIARTHLRSHRFHPSRSRHRFRVNSCKSVQVSRNFVDFESSTDSINQKENDLSQIDQSENLKNNGNLWSNSVLKGKNNAEPITLNDQQELLISPNKVDPGATKHLDYNPLISCKDNAQSGGIFLKSPVPISSLELKNTFERKSADQKSIDYSSISSIPKADSVSPVYFKVSANFNLPREEFIQRAVNKPLILKVLIQNITDSTSDILVSNHAKVKGHHGLKGNGRKMYSKIQGSSHLSDIPKEEGSLNVRPDRSVMKKRWNDSLAGKNLTMPILFSSAFDLPFSGQEKLMKVSNNTIAKLPAVTKKGMSLNAKAASKILAGKRKKMQMKINQSNFKQFEPLPENLLEPFPPTIKESEIPIGQFLRKLKSYPSDENDENQHFNDAFDSKSSFDDNESEEAMISFSSSKNKVNNLRTPEINSSLSKHSVSEKKLKNRTFEERPALNASQNATGKFREDLSNYEPNLLLMKRELDHFSKLLLQILGDYPTNQSKKSIKESAMKKSEQERQKSFKRQFLSIFSTTSKPWTDRVKNNRESSSYSLISPFTRSLEIPERFKPAPSNIVSSEVVSKKNGNLWPFEKKPANYAATMTLHNNNHGITQASASTKKVHVSSSSSWLNYQASNLNLKSSTMSKFITPVNQFYEVTSIPLKLMNIIKQTNRRETSTKAVTANKHSYSVTPNFSDVSLEQSLEWFIPSDQNLKRNKHLILTWVQKLLENSTSNDSGEQYELSAKDCKRIYNTNCVCDMSKVLSNYDSIICDKTASEEGKLHNILDFQCSSYLPLPLGYKINSESKPRILTSKKKQMVSDDNVGPKEIDVEGLNYLLHVGVTSSETPLTHSAFAGSKISIPCFDIAKVSLPTGITDGTKYKWRKGNKVITEGRVKETPEGVLIVDNVALSDAGQYLCTLLFVNPESSSQQQRVFNHTLNVVTVPKIAIQALIHYKANTECTPAILEMFDLYLPQQIQESICDYGEEDSNICLIDVYNPLCFKNSTDSMIISLNVQMDVKGIEYLLIGGANKSVCSTMCHQKLYLKMTLILKESLHEALLTNVLGRTSFTGADFIPMQTSLALKMTIGCDAGFYQSESFCVPCPPHTFSEEGSTQCAKCPFNFYQPQSGSRACIQCPFPLAPGCNTISRKAASDLTKMAAKLLLLLLFIMFAYFLTILITKYFHRRKKGDNFSKDLIPLKIPGSKDGKVKRKSSRKKKKVEEIELRQLIPLSPYDSDNTTGFAETEFGASTTDRTKSGGSVSSDEELVRKRLDFLFIEPSRFPKEISRPLPKIPPPVLRIYPTQDNNGKPGVSKEGSSTPHILNNLQMNEKAVQTPRRKKKPVLPQPDFT